MRFSFFLFASILFFSACTNLQDLTIDPLTPQFAFPLLHSDATIYETLSSVDTAGYLQIMSDSTLELHYEGETRVDAAVNFFAFLFAAPLADTFNRVPLFSDVLKIRIDSAVIKSGTITAWINNGLSSAGSPVPFTMFIPNFTKNGEQFQASFVAPVGISNYLAADLTGYTLVPDADDSITLRYEAYNVLGDRVKFDGFVLNTNGSLQSSFASGYMGKQNQGSFKDTIDIDVFQNLPSGTYNFLEPRLTLTCANSWGVSSSIVINSAKWVTAAGQTLNMESSFINPANAENAIFLNYPSIDEIGQTKYTVFELDKDNSNIEDLINSKPTKLIYDMYAFTNPLDDPDEVSFMTDSSSLFSRFDLNIPLYGTVLDQNYLDTLPIDLSQGGDIDVNLVDSAEFKIKTYNEIPFGGSLQVTLLDENMNYVGDLLSEPVQILPAPTDLASNGASITGAEQITFVTISQDTYSQFSAAKYAILNIQFSTSLEGTVPVRIMAGDRLKVDMGVIVSLSVD